VNASPTMRSLGEVIQQPDKTLRIKPDRGSDLDGIAIGPYQSLKQVMDAIATHLVH
jgi:hypothetical protein